MDGRTRWTFTQFLVALGCALTIAALLIFSGGDLATLVAPEGLPFTILIVLGLVFTVVMLATKKPWAELAAGVAVSLAPGLGVAFGFAILGLSQPQGGLSYTSLLALDLALLLALPAGIVGFRRGVKKAPAPGVGPGWRTGHGLFALAAVALAVGMGTAGLLATEAAKSGGSGGGYDNILPEATVNVVTQHEQFVPTALSLQKGKITEIVIDNKDNELHTFTYQVGDKQYSHDVLPTTVTRFLAKFDAAGDVGYWCIPHSPGMKGTITVAP